MSENKSFEQWLRRHTPLYSGLCRVNEIFGSARHSNEELPERNYLRRTPYPEGFPFCAVPWTIPALISLSVVVLTLVWRYLGRTGSAADYTSAFHVYLGAILFISIWVPETDLRQVARFVNSTKVAEFRSEAFWNTLRLSGAGQVVCLVLGVVAAAAIVPFVYQSLYAEPFFPPLYLPAVITGGLWGIGGYTALMSGRAFVNYVRKAKFDLYVLDPRQSPDTQALSRLFETTLLINSIAIFVIMLPLLRPNPDPVMVLLIGLITIAGLASQLFLVWYNQKIITEVIKAAQTTYINQLQEKIRHLVGDVDKVTPASYGEASPYINLYEKVMANTKDLSLGATRLGFFVRAFLLPLTGFVLNSSEILKVVNEIIKSVFTP